MNRIMRFRPQIGAGLASCAVVGVMTTLFLAARGTDPARYDAASETLRRIKEQDTAVNEDAFELRFGLQNSCDALNDKMTGLAQLRARLRAELNALDSSPLATFQSARTVAEQQGALKQSLAEQFKTSNAMLANSRYYFPAACAFIRGHYARPTAWPEFDADLANLERDILLQNMSGDAALSAGRI